MRREYTELKKNSEEENITNLADVERLREEVRDMRLNHSKDKSLL